MLTELLHAWWPVCAFAIALMFVIWWLALRINNLGIVDIAWSAAFAPASIFFAMITHGYPPRRWLMAGMATVWSLRLGAHLYFRVMGHHPHEDVRYARMRAKWGKNLRREVLIFFQLQAVLIALLSLPFLVVCLDERPGISLTEWLGVSIWLVALAGETLADRQLKRFRARPENRGRICQAGLWHYSRHPNYFFEWLVWVGFFVFAWASPGGCFTVLAPGLMLFFLLRVTGIPLTEELSLQSKGDAYREYQRTTHAFVPWFKRNPR
jgi:steroid 5-alpha reductase family enzyme